MNFSATRYTGEKRSRHRRPCGFGLSGCFGIYFLQRPRINSDFTYIPANRPSNRRNGFPRVTPTAQSRRSSNCRGGQRDAETHNHARTRGSVIERARGVGTERGRGETARERGLRQQVDRRWVRICPKKVVEGSAAILVRRLSNPYGEYRPNG